MPGWRFLEYQTGLGRKVITDWRNGLPVGPRADMDLVLSDLAKSERWKWPQVDALKGDRYRGLIELRWKSSGVQHRIVGEYDGPKRFLMYVGCTHKGNVYDPPDAFDIAYKRRRDRLNGTGGVCEYEV
jgi:hypothetical protein